MQVPDGIDTAGRVALPRQGAITRLLLPALLAAGLLPALLTPVLPLIDLYNHVFRFDVLSRLASDPVLAANYTPQWALLPNIGLDVIAAGLLRLVPAIWLPHIIVSLIFVTMFGGVVAFNRALIGRGRPLAPVLAALLTLPLLYSWILNWGFVNFLLGLGLVFVGAAAWLHLRDRSALRLAVAIPAAVLIFLCHGVAFALYGLLIAALELGHWLQQRPRRPAALMRALAMCLVQAVLPVMLFFASPTMGAAGGLTNADETVVRLWAMGGLAQKLQQLLIYRLETVVRVAEGPGFGVDALWLGAVLALLLWLWRSRLIDVPKMAWPAIGVGALLALFCPPALFGVGAVADRMPLFLALIVVASLNPAPGLRMWHPAMLGLTVLVATRLVSIAVHWQGTSGDLADLDKIAAALPSNQLVTILPSDARPHPEVSERCTIYLHVLAMRDRHIVPLFANQTQQPIALAGRLAAARARAKEGLRALPATPNVADMQARAVDLLASAGFDYVLLCQSASDRPWPVTRYPVLMEAGRFRLLDARKRAQS